jgi:hypothetical protein
VHRRGVQRSCENDPFSLLRGNVAASFLQLDRDYAAMLVDKFRQPERRLVEIRFLGLKLANNRFRAVMIM